MALQRLKEAAEKAKVELSSTQQTEINLPFVTADSSGPKHLAITLSRAKLEQLVGDLVTRTMGPVAQALDDAKMKPDEVGEVILVGGQTRMPLATDKVKEFFGREPHKGVNPDEVVAIGAAIQAGVLKGDVREVLLLDVTPLSLAIETLGGVADAIIPRNTTIPTSKSKTYSTASDNQASVEIHVLQGERGMASDNKSLGRFILDGILPSPRGMPQIEVAFDIDANGILHVSARDTGTGREQKITIQAGTGLSDEEIEQMKRDAEAHAEDDRTRREGVEVRNQADSLAYTAEKTMSEAGDKIPADVRADIEARVKDLRDALASDDASNETLRSAVEALSEALQKAGAAVYGEGAEGAGVGAETGAPGGEGEGDGGDGAGGAEEDGAEEGTVEGEYREV
jgi:molecular chaperone DnaK